MLKHVKGETLEYEAASHEDKKNPGVLKKVLLTHSDLTAGMIPMVNVALLPPEKSFQAHYHEDMEEVFVFTTGVGVFTVGEETYQVEKHDAVVVPAGTIHSLKNTGHMPMEYVVFGISKKGKGRTVVIEK